MKRFVILILILSFTFSIQSCKDACEFNDPVCQETPPTNEDCEAFFQRWFYNVDSNECEQIGYSGCSQKGFDTKEECDLCECE